MPISPNYHILINNREAAVKYQIVITRLTEEEESEVDVLEEVPLILERGDRTFTIKRKNIYCYGDINFNNDKDLKILDNFNFLSHLRTVGVHIPSRYNYDKHECVSPIKKYLISETFSTLELIKYSHAVINKPNKIILFKQEYK